MNVVEKYVELDNPKNKLAMNQRAAEVLSAALLKIFNNTDLRKVCENVPSTQKDQQ